MNILFGKTLEQCQDIVTTLGQPAFRGKQLYGWLYNNRVNEIDECGNLPKTLKDELKKDYCIGHGRIEREQYDPVDGTSKFLIALHDGECIETVLMSYKHGYSICVSSQVGCAMGCAFCASTKNGKVRDLSAGEILDQIYLVEKEKDIRISNVVVMGIGEPLENYDSLLTFIHLANIAWGIGQRKITVSTCGLVPQIEQLAKEDLQINLAISLHSPFQDRRSELMPIARRYNLNELIKVCNNYFTITGRRISYEYALIKDFNDRKEDINELLRLFSGVNCHINLIGLNPISEGVYKGSENVNFFCSELKRKGINCTIRRKIGVNIDAACGQLRRNEINEK